MNKKRNVKLYVLLNVYIIVLQQRYLISWVSLQRFVARCYYIVMFMLGALERNIALPINVKTDLWKAQWY